MSDGDGERASVLWGTADYDRFSQALADAHETLVDRLEPRPGVHWLDVCCGTGAVAERAASAGASATAVDIAPGQIDIARRRAAQLGLEIRYEVADCERLTFDDASFDVVSSSFGAYHASDVGAAVAELKRVTAPGGHLGLATRSATSRRTDAMYAVIPDVSPLARVDDAHDWGRPGHLDALFGDAFELVFEERTSVREFESSEAHWQLYREHPRIRARLDSLDASGRGQLHDSWIAFCEENYRRGEVICHPLYWLLTVGVRR